MTEPPRPVAEDPVCQRPAPAPGACHRGLAEHGVAGRGPAPSLASPPPWVVVVNGAAGRRQGEALAGVIRDAVSAAGCQVSVRQVARAGELEATAAAAAAHAGALRGLLVAVGGDGTLNTVARAAMGAGVAFSAIPQGTFNYFGRCHGFPADPAEAVAAVLGGHLRPVQVGSLNGRIFLVNASFGLYPRLLEDREAFKQQWGRSRLTAWGAALLTLLGQHRQHPIRLQAGAPDGPGVERSLTSSTVFVANNRLQLEQLGVPEAAELEAGRLVGLVLRPLGRGALLGLALKGALGRLGEADAVERLVFRCLQIEPGRRWWPARDVAVAIDGESIRMRPPLVFSVAERPLWLLAPREAA